MKIKRKKDKKHMNVSSELSVTDMTTKFEDFRVEEHVEQKQQQEQTMIEDIEQKSVSATHRSKTRNGVSRTVEEEIWRRFLFVDGSKNNSADTTSNYSEFSSIENLTRARFLLHTEKETETNVCLFMEALYTEICALYHHPVYHTWSTFVSLRCASRDVQYGIFSLVVTRAYSSSATTLVPSLLLSHVCTNGLFVMQLCEEIRRFFIYPVLKEVVAPGQTTYDDDKHPIRDRICASQQQDAERSIPDRMGASHSDAEQNNEMLIVDYVISPFYSSNNPIHHNNNSHYNDDDEEDVVMSSSLTTTTTTTTTNTIHMAISARDLECFYPCNGELELWLEGMYFDYFNDTAFKQNYSDLSYLEGYMNHDTGITDSFNQTIKEQCELEMLCLQELQKENVCLYIGTDFERSASVLFCHSLYHINTVRQLESLWSCIQTQEVSENVLEREQKMQQMMRSRLFAMNTSSSSSSSDQEIQNQAPWNAFQDICNSK